MATRPESQRDPAGELSPAAVIELTRQFLAGLKAGSRRITLDSSLERDLGLDSRCRVELVVNIERAFGVAISEKVLGDATTIGDLLVALRKEGGFAPFTPGVALPKS